ncbi:MAG TPA: ATP cone domain-containing protein [Acidobacteriota bacterium]|nr:ATP cone domain-containing protein [Acidobacteriota bacterium]
MKIVKRRGHEEAYDEKKVYASVFAAAINCHYHEEQSEHIAQTVMTKINSFMKSRKTVTSGELRAQIIETIFDEDVRLMYKHHLDVC